jgi:hypothetical protein
MATQRWSELSEGRRRAIMALGIFEGILKIAALVDLRQRASDEIRGPKKVWALVIVFVNGVGIAPLTYFVFGRRKQGGD